MVTKAMAAALCSISPANYDKYARKKLLPPMNATNRVSIAALEQAAKRLDGVVGEVAQNDADDALERWARDR
jgi:hypothetical protein